MSNLLNTQVTAEDIAAASERKSFDNTPVAAGEYDMVISPTTPPTLRIGQTSKQPYLRMVLNHAEKGKGPNVFVNFTSHVIGKKLFAQMLLSAGYSTEQVLGAGFKGIDGASEDSKGNLAAEIVLGDGTVADLAARPVRAYLSIKKNVQGEDRNEVSNFITSL